MRNKGKHIALYFRVAGMSEFLILTVIFLPMYQGSYSNSGGRMVNKSGEEGELQRRISINNTPRQRQAPSKHSSNTLPNGNDILNYLTSTDYFPKERLNKLVQVSSTSISPETPSSQENQVKNILLRGLFPNRIRDSSRPVTRTSSQLSEIILMPDKVEYKVSSEMLSKGLKCSKICTSLFTNTCNIRELFSHCGHVKNEYKPGTTKYDASQISLIIRQCETFKYLTYTFLIIILSLSITLMYIFIRMKEAECKINNHGENKKKNMRSPSNYKAPPLEYMNVTLPLSLLRRSTAKLYDVPTCPARPISTINHKEVPEDTKHELYNDYEDMCGVLSKKAKIEGTLWDGVSMRNLSN